MPEKPKDQFRRTLTLKRYISNKQSKGGSQKKNIIYKIQQSDQYGFFSLPVKHPHHIHISNHLRTFHSYENELFDIYSYITLVKSC